MTNISSTNVFIYVFLCILYKTIPFCQFQNHLLKVRHLPCSCTKRFILMEHQTTKPERILKLLQIIPRNWLNKLWNCQYRKVKWSCRISWKNDQPRKNLDKLTIYSPLNRILFNFMSVSICCESVNKSVSLFHTQFPHDLLFFLNQFQSLCVYKVFSYTKIKLWFKFKP